MPKQLDILVLEPFYGGARRSMVEQLIHSSRHRWTLLKLPPRRIERRLAAAAHWFAEQLTRHWVGNIDLLFTSEALNLADLYRVMSVLAEKPAVVYFHDNQLPDPGTLSKNPALDFANLNTAVAATQIWFNSKYHIRVFLSELSALVWANEELSAQNPIPPLTNKIRYMPPPVDLSVAHEIGASEKMERKPGSIVVEMRGANLELLNAALAILQRRGDRVELTTIGPANQLSSDIPRQSLAEDDVVGQTRALMQAATFVSVRIGAPFDENAVRALALGCRAVLPRAGVYPELVPKPMQGFFLYDVDADSLASRIQDALHRPAEIPAGAELAQALQQFDPIAVCNAMDERLSEIAETFVAPKAQSQV
jgi:glycosyltransferase involved in cell wall biosynthesis